MINKRNRDTIIKIIIDVILVILLYNILLVGISCINRIEEISIFGCKAYVITTNSMSPKLKDGDVLITKKVNEEILKVGDIITFKKNGINITHRITKIDEENGQKIYTTKGDNNTLEDSEKVKFEEIEGKSLVKIPFLGKIIKCIQNQTVFLIIILLILILIYWKINLIEKKNIRREKKRIEKEKRKKEQDN